MAKNGDGDGAVAIGDDVMDEAEQPQKRWQAGETVALRYLRRADGKAGNSWPYTVVKDSDEVVALYIPAGAVHKRWGMQDGQRTLLDQAWRRETLRLMFPGAGHSTWLSWDKGEAGRVFRGYYVNMEEPFRRTAIGFDTNDHCLDIVVKPDLAWEWKDEEEFARLIESGSYTSEFGAAVRAEGERVVALIEQRASPFADAWDTWQPDPEWAMPVLPETWLEHPGAKWDRRQWAYGEMAR